MFETLTPQTPDKIIRLMQMFCDDARMGKIDLGVGVWKNAAGQTPVMAAVKDAERRLVETQDSKSYIGLAGDPAFLNAMCGLLLGPDADAGRIAAVGTPGGTGAVRQVLELVRLARPGCTVWISAPTWPNHPALIDTVGLQRRDYRYYDPATGAVDRKGMLADLGALQPGDVVLLHGCCHNPAGADLARTEWEALASVLAERGAVPFVDMAYQGFGAGLDQDAAGLRILAARLPEVLVAASCSKNFGLYRDRVGMAMALCADATARDTVQGTLAWLNRQNFAFPPDHGARVVQTILDDAALCDSWKTELEAMRLAMEANRRALADALRDATRSDRFGFLAAHQGMFSLLGLTPGQVARLRDDHGIYLVDDSRLNIAGLTEATIPVVAEAVAKVL
ncbi:aromatic amino acid transaminase [Plastorhodobacter daqingensis]|uniref:Aminotransferase n=1 Tax=Plastorhodobacter daqingensis TaxID=1387281 RepID=A0ABW2UHZ1_9RHOB